MILPPGLAGVAFTEASDGDMRRDRDARFRLSSTHGLPSRWATIDQVHGNAVVRASQEGIAAEADALWTTEPDLALAVFTADCLGVVLVAPGAVGVAHAGWRGAEARVVGRLRADMSKEGHQPFAAAVGPGIGPCCFEVGDEVAERFSGHTTTTTWGTQSVDLRSVVASQLTGLALWIAAECTLHDEGFFSHREDGTARRMAALGWLA